MPEKIGKYEILEQIGVGGFGAVYRGRDPFIKRTVAVKTCQLNDDEIKSRFFREAELAGNLHHRNITTIYDFGVEDGIPYIVQEFLTGEDLDKIIKRGDEVPVSRKIEILSAIAEGLAYAHRHSIIHRDIKPANIRVLEDGSVKIMDFGIAKSLLSESSLTQTGITLGTSAYLAPEQIRGEPLDQRTDMFALGTLAYELLSYRKPFRGEHLSTVLYKILNENPEPVNTVNPDVPRALAETVARAMEKSIESRHANMDAFRHELMTIYGQIVGASGRFTANQRPSQIEQKLRVTPADPDMTVATPSRGFSSAASITPPSGALARVPSPTPTGRVPPDDTARAPGLELVAFQDPTRRTADRKTEVPGRPSSHRLLWVAAVVAIAASGAVLYLLGRPGPSGTNPRAGPTPAPTAPLVFPQPIAGTEPGAPRASADAATATSSAPVVPTAAPRVDAAPAPVAAVQTRPTPRVSRHFKVQFSSIPVAVLSVDGRKYGPSIPAKVVELVEGTHTVRFEARDLPAYEKTFQVGPNGSPPVAYRFPIGSLVIRAPEWTGATVLIDSKFRGTMTAERSFPLSSGAHQITLSREGVAPLTQEVVVPEGDKKTWSPPPPVPAS